VVGREVGVSTDETAAADAADAAEREHCYQAALASPHPITLERFAHILLRERAEARDEGYKRLREANTQLAEAWAEYERFRALANQDECMRRFGEMQELGKALDKAFSQRPHKPTCACTACQLFRRLRVLGARR
jgi:hypothetical protein